MGKVINVMSSDFSKLQMFFVYIFKVFVAPFSFIGVIIVLFITFGWTAVITMGMMVITTLTQYFVTKKMGDIMKIINRMRDERMKKLNLIIGGIKALKMYSWESYFNQ